MFRYILTSHPSLVGCAIKSIITNRIGTNILVRPISKYVSNESWNKGYVPEQTNVYTPSKRTQGSIPQVLTGPLTSDEIMSMYQRNAAAHKFAKKLIKQGHKCVVYMESYPVQIGWCGQCICKQSQRTTKK